MPSTVNLCTGVLFQSGATKDFPYFSQMKIVPGTGAFVVFVKSRYNYHKKSLQSNKSQLYEENVGDIFH